jgi:hypothetical protein
MESTKARIMHIQQSHTVITKLQTCYCVSMPMKLRTNWFWINFKIPPITKVPALNLYEFNNDLLTTTRRENFV